MICKGNISKGVQNVGTQTLTRERRPNDIHYCGMKRLITFMVSLQIYWNNVSQVSVTGFPDPNKANAAGSLSTHFGFTLLTKSCVTNEQSELVSNITVALAIPWLPCTVTRANCNTMDGCDWDMWCRICNTDDRCCWWRMCSRCIHITTRWQWRRQWQITDACRSGPHSRRTTYDFMVAAITFSTHNTAPLCSMSRQQTLKTQTCRF